LESAGVPTTEQNADRRGSDRRRGDRRSGPRRAEDEAERTRYTLQAAFWALCGALVVLYLFFVAIGGVNPTKGWGWTVAALVLALLYTAHAGQRLWRGGHSSRPDRERRGF
jgi:hypothetical protein